MYAQMFILWNVHDRSKTFPYYMKILLTYFSISYIFVHFGNLEFNAYVLFWFLSVPSFLFP